MKTPEKIKRTKLLENIKSLKNISPAKTKTINTLMQPLLFFNLQFAPGNKTILDQDILLLQHNKSLKNCKSRFLHNKKNNNNVCPRYISTFKETNNENIVQTKLLKNYKPKVKSKSQIVIHSIKIITNQERDGKMMRRLYIDKVKVIQRYWKKHKIVFQLRINERKRLTEEIFYSRKVIMIQRHYNQYYNLKQKDKEKIILGIQTLRHIKLIQRHWKKYHQRLLSMKAIIIQRQLKVMFKAKHKAFIIKKTINLFKVFKTVILTRCLLSFKQIKTFEKTILLRNEIDILKLRYNIMNNCDNNAKYFGGIKSFPRPFIESTIKITYVKRRLEIDWSHHHYTKEGIDLEIIGSHNEKIIKSRPLNNIMAFYTHRKYIGNDSMRNKHIKYVSLIQREYRKWNIIRKHKDKINDKIKGNIINETNRTMSSSERKIEEINQENIYNENHDDFLSFTK